MRITFSPDGPAGIDRSYQEPGLAIAGLCPLLVLMAASPGGVIVVITSPQHPVLHGPNGGQFSRSPRMQSCITRAIYGSRKVEDDISGDYLEVYGKAVEHRRFKLSRALLFFPLVALLIVAVACGGTAAPAEPIVVEKEVIKEVPKEIVVEKEVIKEVPKEIIVEKEVIKEVAKEVVREVEVLVQPTLAPIAAPAEQDVPDWVETGKGKHYNALQRHPSFRLRC